MNDITRNYYSDPAYNYSLLKAMDSSQFDALNMLNGDRKKTTALRKGGIIDTLLTGTQEEFFNTYKVFPGKFPADKAKLFCDSYIQLYNNSNEDLTVGSVNEELIMKARDESGFDKRLTKAKVIEKYNEFLPYIAASCDPINSGKELISISDYNNAKTIALNLQSDPICGYYLSNSINTQIFYQVPIFGKYEHDGYLYEIKGLLDILLVDYQHKIIIPVDVKTYSDNFVANYYYYKYYLQAELYSYLTRNFLLPEEYAEYTMGNFTFIAINKITQIADRFIHAPNSFELDTIWDGGNLNKNEYRSFTKGINNLLKELNWHIKNNRWDHTFEYYMNNYILLNKG